MKGIGYWLWIAGSIIIALLIFSIGYKYISETYKKNTELESLESFERLVNLVNNLCWSFSGNKREYTLTVFETVQGIYASRSNKIKFTENELLEKIKLKEISEGEYLCIQIKNKRIRCEKIECNVSLPFLGFNKEEPNFGNIFNKLVGKGNKFEYKLNLEKTAKKVVVTVR